MNFSNFTTFMVIVCVSRHAYTSESAISTIDCTEFRSCMRCVNQTQCSWSLERQNCVRQEDVYGNLVVHVESDCPQFTVTKSTWLKNAFFSYTLTVSNDKKNFMAFLRQVNILCTIQTSVSKGQVEQNDIKCNGIRRTTNEFQYNSPTIFYFRVQFNNSVTLRLDNDSDYYVQIYDRECGVSRDDDCVKCAWIADGYVNYFKRCSSKNRCTGLYQFYDRRYAQNFTSPVMTTVPKTVPLRCTNASVESVAPVSAPWTGGTTVRVTVKNHWILTEKKSVTVTVAGRKCYRLISMDKDAFACIVSPPTEDPKTVGGAKLAEGSIVVEYGSSQNFSISSAFAFKLVDPRLTDVSPTCGPLSGGTSLTIAGEHLDTGNAVRVVIGNDTTCAAVVRSPDRILCVTGAAETPTDGIIRAVFDGGLTRLTADRRSFAYTDNPVLDAAQPLAGIVSGGTAVPVRGRHFTCAHNTTMAVHLHNGTVHQTGCRVHNDTFMVCQSPILVADDLLARRVQQTTADATEDLGAAATPIGQLECELRVAYDDGLTAKLRPSHGDAMPAYRFYADPVLDDFATDGHVITVIGRNLDWGYAAQYSGNDTVVRLLVNNGSSTSGACDVTSVDRHRIVCVPRAAVDLDTVRALNVTFGVSFRRVVRRMHRAHPVDDGRLPWTDFCAVVAVAVAAVLSLCVALYVIMFRKQNNFADTSSALFELQTPHSDRHTAM